MNGVGFGLIKCAYDDGIEDRRKRMAISTLAGAGVGAAGGYGYSVLRNRKELKNGLTVIKELLGNESEYNKIKREANALMRKEHFRKSRIGLAGGLLAGLATGMFLNNNDRS